MLKYISIKHKFIMIKMNYLRKMLITLTNKLTAFMMLLTKVSNMFTKKHFVFVEVLFFCIFEIKKDESLEKIYGSTKRR